MATILHVRPTGPEDVDRVVAWESAPDNVPFLTQWPRERHLAVLDDPTFGHRILEDGTGVGIGYLVLAGLNGPHRSIELARIAIEVKGRGYGRAALRWTKAFAFEEQSAHRLWLDVFPHNERARTLYESEGWRVEGTLRECVFHQGRHRSLTVLSILEDEWRAWRPA